MKTIFTLKKYRLVRYVKEHSSFTNKTYSGYSFQKTANDGLWFACHDFKINFLLECLNLHCK